MFRCYTNVFKNSHETRSVSVKTGQYIIIWLPNKSHLQNFRADLCILPDFPSILSLQEDGWVVIDVCDVNLDVCGVREWNVTVILGPDGQHIAGHRLVVQVTCCPDYTCGNPMNKFYTKTSKNLYLTNIYSNKAKGVYYY